MSRRIGESSYEVPCSRSVPKTSRCLHAGCFERIEYGTDLCEYHEYLRDKADSDDRDEAIAAAKGWGAE